ncbi:hypothetical protein ACIQU6_41645 [Streptomyces sp. NPDC090442]|uniref:hypothetical protein n=1 Tax=Streptomyces sp. NPDC090442 TaxID=3365962 RepID=UPI00380259D2
MTAEQPELESSEKHEAKVTQVIPGTSWPVRPGAPGDEEPAPGPRLAASSSPPMPAAGGAGGGAGDGGGWWSLVAAPTPPPPGGGATGAWPWGAPGPAPAAPLEVRVTVDLVKPDAEPELTWFQRVRAWWAERVTPHGAVIALAASVVPIPIVGYGVGPIWGSFLWTCRIHTHPVVAYIVGFGALALAWRRLVRGGGTPVITSRRASPGGAFALFLVSTSVIGVIYGAVRPLDIVTLLTGVPA